jgi:hypothetical protein
VTDLERLEARRRRAWCQDGERTVPDPEAARAFVDRVGIATLYAASPEIPSLYQAHMSDPKPPTFASWDSPSGHVYTWRWALGNAHAAFYGAVVAKKPTWVAFDLLPALLGGLADRRTPRELFEAGELSSDALRVAEAFVGSGGILATAELRDRAGFPKGKENRAAYLKAVEELDARLMLAKRFTGEGEDAMGHAWVRDHYAREWEAGAALDPTDALATVLDRVLVHAATLDPKVLARHLRVPPARMDAAFHLLADRDRARPLGKLWITTTEEPS